MESFQAISLLKCMCMCVSVSQFVNVFHIIFSYSFRIIFFFVPFHRIFSFNLARDQNHVIKFVVVGMQSIFCCLKKFYKYATFFFILFFFYLSIEKIK